MSGYWIYHGNGIHTLSFEGNVVLATRQNGFGQQPSVLWTYNSANELYSNARSHDDGDEVVK